ncbi:Flp pilus assembly protein CpaB [Modestobacter sp. I12A-02662]|uniref:Flp pilus assembly protein CpaB n=1 Tax=Modestobacter sp. I12A-02662 TaxID=1730496 RepID=UPI0034E0505C
MPRFRRPRSPARLVRQVAAALLACLALVLAVRPPGPGSPAPLPMVQVTVAVADLPAGTTLGAGDLTTAALPGDVVPDGSTSEPGALTGQVLAAPVRSGEPVTDVRLVGPGLWSQVPAGEVAAPVRLADLAVATLLRAGDRVDVLAATASPGGPLTAPDPGGATVVVVAAGALVLAAPPAATEPGGAGTGTAGDGLLVLAVHPDTAARLAAAAATSTLTVTLGRP